MADEKADLGATPDAIARRHDDVTLSNGKVVKVHKWSTPKFQKLIRLVGNIDQVQVIAVESVEEKDRAAVEDMGGEDHLALAVAATALNVTPATLKNFAALLKQSGDIQAALGIKVPQ